MKLSQVKLVMTALPSLLSLCLSSAVASPHAIYYDTQVTSIENLVQLQPLSLPSLRHRLSTRDPAGSTNLLNTLNGFGANINLGTQEFTVMVDTGSSALLLAENTIQCPSGVSTSDSCGFSATYTPDTNFHEIANETFVIGYVTSSDLSGLWGQTTVEVADISVPNVYVALANETLGLWSAPPLDGIMGLSFRNGGALINNNTANQASLAESMFSQQLSASWFSVTLSRNDSQGGSGGYLGFGGRPDDALPSVNTSNSPWAIVPMLTNSSGEYDSFSINVTAFMVESNGQAVAYVPHSNYTAHVLDTGTGLNLVDPQVATAINTAFDPPGTLGCDTCFWTVPCNATPPTLGVVIGQETFYVNAADMISPPYVVDGDCLTQWQSLASEGLVANSILGNPFLTNVLAVFDLGNKLIGLKGRQWYQ